MNEAIASAIQGGTVPPCLHLESSKPGVSPPSCWLLLLIDGQEHAQNLGWIGLKLSSGFSPFVGSCVTLVRLLSFSGLLSTSVKGRPA